ncbi:MAG: DUF2069 domain-containing protein [Pseudomonadales bacterium]|nr:DUF2069 domain-containing protein [Pseudomonadales bacterium]
MAQRITLGQRCAFGGSLLLLLFAALPLFLADASVTGWLLQSLPLMLLLPGLWRGDRRSLQWLGFVTLFLLVPGILQLFAPTPRLRALHWCKVLGSLAVFSAAVYTAQLYRTQRSSSSPL